jgi:tetratricopeptide (TPR) repeat protein
MARAAVRAKQAQAAQAQAAAKPRRDRKHASGGNPNQDLFFMRLRRKQKWVFLGLAVVFAVSFTLLGVGSGTGGGLTQLWNSIFAGNSDAVSKAQGEVKTDPAKGYRDLALAYQTQGDLANAVTAMNSYLQVKKTDASGWTQLAGYYQQQGQTAYTQYQQVLASTQIQSPSSVIAPTGKLAGAFGTNPIDDFYSKQSSSQTGPLYQQATTAFSGAMTAYQNAAKYSKGKNAKAAALYQAFQEASYAGNQPAALADLQQYVHYRPSAAKSVEKICKQLGGSCILHPQKHKKK